MNGRDPINNARFTSARIALLLAAAGLCVFGQEPADPAAMVELARRYQNGIDCPRDIGRALVYYKRAAGEGNSEAMVALGDLYREGVCVPQDLTYSTGMYRQASAAGFAPGMMRLGDALESGGRRDEAIGWY